MSSTSSEAVIDTSPADRAAVVALRAEVLRCLDFSVPPRVVSTQYRRATAVMLAALVALYALCGAFVLFLLWLVGWHAYSIFASWRYGPYFLYHGPMALAGLIIAVMVIKPLFFSGKSRKDPKLILTASEEPLLFEFVTGLCRKLDAPLPARIEVDCQANASAAFDVGIFGFVRGTLVLRIGLPLVGGLSLRQFTGVIAHELGHFSQHTGMRGSYLIRWLNHFLSKAVFQRDRLDQKLLALRYQQQGFAVLFYWMMWAMIEPSRGALWLMLVAGNVVTRHMQRRMEFDADLVSASVIGSREFSETNIEIVMLGIASQRVHQRLSQSWAHRRLADDFSRWVALDARVLREESPLLAAEIAGKTTGWFDTHPSHRDRADNVEAHPTPGVFDISLPASSLFGDFGGLCGRATRSLYSSILAEHADKAVLVPTEEMVEEWHGQSAHYRGLHRYFRGFSATDRPLFPSDELLLEVQCEECVSRLTSAREVVDRESSTLYERVRSLRELSQQCMEARATLALTELFYGNARARRMRRRAGRQLRKWEPLLKELQGRVTAFEEASSRRLALSLHLARIPSVLAAVQEPARVESELITFLPLAQVLRDVLPTIEMLRQTSLNLRYFLSAYRPKQPHRALVQRIMAASEALHQGMTSIREKLDVHVFPFQHATEGMRAGSSLVSDKLPETRAPADMQQCATAFVDRYASLSYRVMSRLTDIAERMEGAVGLAPLEALDLTAEAAAQNKANTKKRRRQEMKLWLAYGSRAAAGLVLMTLLVRLSLHPPVMPAWSDGGSGGAYQPEAFSFSVNHYNRYTPTGYHGTVNASPLAPLGRYIPQPGAPIYTAPAVQAPIRFGVVVPKLTLDTPGTPNNVTVPPPSPIDIKPDDLLAPKEPVQFQVDNVGGPRR